MSKNEMEEQKKNESKAIRPHRSLLLLKKRMANSKHTHTRECSAANEEKEDRNKRQQWPWNWNEYKKEKITNQRYLHSGKNRIEKEESKKSCK